MRLLVLTESFDPARGGAERSLFELFRALCRLGLSVEVLANSSPLKEPWLHTLEGPKISRRQGLAAFAARAREFCRQARPDIVHSITPAYGGDVYQPRAGCLPVLFEASLARPAGPLAHRIRRLAFKFNAKRQALLALEKSLIAEGQALVCPVSQTSARHFIQAYRLAPERLQVVFNAVDIIVPGAEEKQRLRAAQRAEWGLKPSEKAALFVGHDFARKGLATAIEAIYLAAVKEKRPWRLLVLGQDSSWPYRRLASRLGVGGLVSFLKPAKSAVPAMLAADLLLLPSRFDPCSRVVLEAMILGRPAATTPQDGASEAIEDHKSGFILKGPDEAEAAARVMAALEDPRLAEAVSLAAQAKAEYLQVSRMARELAGIYEGLLAKKRSGQGAALTGRVNRLACPKAGRLLS